MRALIVHRKNDGSRCVLVAPPELCEAEWPYLETFDEVANALDAFHLLDEDVLKDRLSEAQAAAQAIADEQERIRREDLRRQLAYWASRR